MTSEAMAVHHVDLSRERSGPKSEGRPVLAVFWWRDLPLGMIAGSPEEVPLSRAALEALLTRFAAEQRAARDQALGAPLDGDADGRPKNMMTLRDAADARATLAWLNRTTTLPHCSAEELSVIVCTRDRGAALARCLTHLLAQRSPAGELIVVDNSTDGSAAGICAAYPGVLYVPEPRPGLSHARNTGLVAATRSLVAFTDDDVEPHPRWTEELVRALSDSGCEAVSGLVLPTRLDTPAQAFFQMKMAAFGTGFVPVRFGRSFYREARQKALPVWGIGAGANMAFRKAVFDRVGMFDTRLGAGASGCSEDSEMWYRIIASGGTCQYEPRAVVFHDHRGDWPGLRRQMRAYLHGHVSALVAQADMFNDRRNLRRIYVELPRYFARTLMKAIHQQDAERRRILREEFIGWFTGLRYVLRSRWRVARPPIPVAAQEKTG